MIKICDTSLQIIFDIRTGIFSDKWKMSDVCPIHKKDSKNLKENYRSISLLPILAKMLEQIIVETLVRLGSWSINHLTRCRRFNLNRYTTNYQIYNYDNNFVWIISVSVSVCQCVSVSVYQCVSVSGTLL